MLLTICTLRQLPQALALGDSFRQFSATDPFILIGLADDPAQLPPGFTSPYPILPIQDILPVDERKALSAQYTPTEFAAACKPLFITEAFRRYPEINRLIYADPNIHFSASTDPIWAQLENTNFILTPFITRDFAMPGTTAKSWPDEKAFQNIGLYNADFLAFKRSAETERMLAWWDNRVRERAFINFCAGLCLDQIWLMHVPVFFRNVSIVKNSGWHVGLWNLPERTIHSASGHWQVNGPSDQNQALQFVNYKGLYNSDEGFFPHQNRTILAKQPAIKTLINTYRQAILQHMPSVFETLQPAYGQQTEARIIRGWRYKTIQSMQGINRFLDRVYLPAIR
ncbi:hypothetical protein [Spirosoma aerolatum]|uniref:hypothetical protein n=1 Tax=Spirosoma aerolatum TaxID=1211326 RepID=UPI0009ADB2D8|nr:hypothetical protein [Spirosoma aerolatum]